MRKGTKRNLFVAATYGAVLLLGIMLGQNYGEERDGFTAGAFLPLGIVDKTSKVQRLIDLIAANYVDSIDVDKLSDLAIDQLVAQLDPHSQYLRPNQALKQYEALEGNFEGIGIEYYNLNDTLMTVGLVSNGPAQQAGMRVGDKLVAINGDTIAGVGASARNIEAKIRGRRGTAIEITINRNGKNLPLPLKVLRDRVELSSIDAAYILDSATAYIKIKRFGAKTAEDFKRSLQHLKKVGAQRLVLDLRENRGGYFLAATALTSQFFDDRRLIVYTEGANEPRVDYYSSADGIFGKGDLAVLIDEQSASASEIVAGAIQDLDRGVIVGRQSFGKALVQEQFGFGDGSVLNLTVARYFTPSGRCIQKHYAAGPPVIADKHVQVGGGIAPNIVVPIDSNGVNPLYRQIRSADLIERYVYGRLTKQVPAYAVENYLKGYFLPDSDYQDFLKQLREQGVDFTSRQAKELHPMVRNDMEALLGRYYFGSEAFFKIRNRSDNVLAEALAALTTRSAHPTIQ